MSGRDPLRILLVGNGGREHALAWKLSQSPRVESIAVVPGNGGTSEVPKCVNVSNIKINDYQGLAQWAKSNNINLVVPGPEAPLVDGIEQHFREIGIRCFGPSKEAARLEGSKAYAKDFMHRHCIPTAKYCNFKDYEAAKTHLDSIDYNVVIKASGIAAGKGVLIPATKEEAHKCLREVMVDKEFGSAGDEVVIEEFLEGDELSILSFSDGFTIRSLPPAQDHKRVGDGDTGLNTGGMGCYAPTPLVSKETIEKIHRDILQPTIDGMAKEQCPFRGILFTGLMMTKDGPKVLEYNVRFGDPETQTVLPLIPDTDLAELIVASCEGWLRCLDIKTSDQFATTVVAAAGGYPGSYVKGKEIIIDEPSSLVFHAGTSRSNGTLQTSGGRVLASTATGATLQEAVAAAYEGMKHIKFEDMHYRKDIAHRAFEHHPNQTHVTYASAGVSVENGNSLVERIKPIVRSTQRPGADTAIGGFGGVFDLAAAGFGDESVMVLGCDGVGTKLKIAQAIGVHDTIGIDLVAMSVNDLIVQGAQPLTFMDIFSCGKLDIDIAVKVVAGIAEGCRQANCALVGGETAEMPGLLPASEYDVVGSATGAVARSSILPKKDAMKPGDVLLGFPSTGIHSNGFSLVRKILSLNKLSYTSTAPWDPQQTTGLSLLTPTKIYQFLVPICAYGFIKGLAHITGGGLIENVPRMLPPHLAAEIDVGNWEVPEVFKWLKTAGNVEASEMAKAFNNGIGMVACVGKENVEDVLRKVEEAGEKVWTIGRLIDRSEAPCVLRGLESWD